MLGQYADGHLPSDSPARLKSPPMADLVTLRGHIAKLLAAGSLAYTGFLVFMTHYPKPQELLGKDLPPDKLLHFLAYGVLGMLVTAAVVTRSRWSWRTAAITAVALAGFAAIDEVTQPFFGRDAEPLDWVWDVVGLMAGLAAVAVARRLFYGSLARRLEPTQ